LNAPHPQSTNKQTNKQKINIKIGKNELTIFLLPVAIGTLVCSAFPTNPT